ncbi:hypothetical protein Aph01nite_74220 [Acrocarpospora phusangensis]|uniref:Uncharacterized protein n=1 Tax=Acrocarpospora phusangensis TaxID=1070424 RepID=A0A919QMZ5_9ACTN|nr:hypothetical protein [Acrocarpospora phusangensis]GIH29112.1 hypothetical protein Aph01nite_74220 [Acrocarpospora phusangensis]
MSWIYAAAGLGVAGLAVLGVLAARVLTAARGLGRELDRARRRIEPAHARLRAEIANRPSEG